VRPFGEEEKMRRFVVALLATSALTFAAQAADLPVKAPVYKAPPVMLYNWTGFYLGINGGGAWGRSSFDFSTGTTSGNYDLSGGLVGGTVGYNWQITPWVLGIEGDIDWADIKGSAACPNPAFSCETKNNWLATVRGRFGYAIDNWLIYGTAGGAFGDVKLSVPGPVAFPGQTITRSGWTAGGGIEYGITPNLSVKAEYLYVDLGTATCDVGNCSATASASSPFRVSVVRAGLNWRFTGF
jgi:outer membrane immunogenic protein